MGNPGLTAGFATMDFPTGPRVFDYDNPNWARHLLLQLRYNIPLTDHDHIARIIQAFINRQLQFPLPSGDDKENRAVGELTANGFCRLGQVLTGVRLPRFEIFLILCRSLIHHPRVAAVLAETTFQSRSTWRDTTQTLSLRRRICVILPSTPRSSRWCQSI
jgi:hypothetical protein